MTGRRRKLTDDEVEAEVIADLEDPAAWDEPIHVPPSRSTRPAWVLLGRHLELSARFYLLSVLHRLGAEASLTNAYPDDVDITVVQAPGRALTIDVKTLIGTSTWLVQPFSARKHHYVTFVTFPELAAEDPGVAPDVIVFPSLRLKSLLGHCKSGAVDIQALARELGIENPWQQLVAEAA